MAVVERRPCEFSLIRYVPDAVKNEFVNIGVFLQEQGAASRAELRLTRDWSRVRCFDPLVDVAMLESLEEELRERLQQTPDLLEGLRGSLGTTVQITAAKGCLAETFLTQVEQLMRMYVEGHKQPREEKRGGRVAILGEMRRQFEQGRVWGMMAKRIAAARYTRAGDPLHLDCGYRTNGTLKIFQAVSLDRDVEAAVQLAFAAPSLVRQVAALEKARLELTAIVEPIRELGEEPERVLQYEFGRDAMQGQAIRVMVTSDLPRMAATAAADLRV